MSSALGGNPKGKGPAIRTPEPPPASGHIVPLENVQGRSPRTVAQLIQDGHAGQMRDTQAKFERTAAGLRRTAEDDILFGGSASTMGSEVSSYNEARHMMRADYAIDALLEAGMTSYANAQERERMRDIIAQSLNEEKRMMLGYNTIRQQSASRNAGNAEAPGPSGELYQTHCGPPIGAQPADSRRNMSLMKPGETHAQALERLSKQERGFGANYSGIDDSMLGLGINSADVSPESQGG